MIKVVNLTQHYGVRPVLKDVNLEVADGELVVVMGPNGMGKSTLLAAMAGILCPQKGHVEIDGMVRRRTEEEEIAIRKRVVYLPADAWLPGLVTGREFLLAVGRLYDVNEDRLFEHIERLFQLFDLKEKADSILSGYSTGQRKKIALSSALISDAPIMLLDEPFAGGLDPGGILALKRVLKHLAERKDRTLVIAVPVPEIVGDLAGRIAVIRDGEIIACDTPGEILRHAGGSENLGEALERLMNPNTVENIERYLEGEMK